VTRSVERRIFFNTAVLGISEVVGQFANFGFVVLLTRRFGVELLGGYSFAMALGAVLAPFVSLGAVSYVTRELARDPGRAGAYFAALRPVQLSSGLAVWLVMALTALLAGMGRNQMLVIVIVGAYHVLLRMAALYLAPAAANQRLLSTAIVGGGHRVLFAILATVAIMAGCDAPLALLAMPASALLSLLAARAYVHRGTPAALPSSTHAVNTAAVVRASLPFLGTAVLMVMYSRGGVLLLTALRGQVATGMFAAADRLVAPFYMTTAMFVTAVSPALARLAVEPDRMRELARGCLRLTLLVTIPLAAALAIFSSDITTIVFGIELRGSAYVLALLAPLLVLRSISSLWMSQCIAIGEEQRMAITRAKAVAVFFVLGATAIVAGGPVGLAVATVLSEVYLAWGLQRLFSEHSHQESAWRIARAPGAAAVCAAAGAALATPLALPARVALVAGILVLVTVLLGGIRGQDLRFFAAMLRRESVGGPGNQTSSLQSGVPDDRN